MEQSIGRATEPTTDGGTSDAGRSDSPELVAPEAPEPRNADIDAEVRQAPARRPAGAMPEDTGITDLDALQRSVDPLDLRRPGRPTNDPLDPDGHVI